MPFTCTYFPRNPVYLGTLFHSGETSQARKLPTACCSSNAGSEVKELSSVSKYVSKCLTMVVRKPSFTAETNARAFRRMVDLALTIWGIP